MATEPTPAAPDSRPGREPWRRLCVAAVAALALLEMLWELWLAPVRPGGTWLALKALPLLLLWPGLARRDLKATQWLSLLLPLYAAEAVVRVATTSGRHAAVAGTASVLAVVAFCALVMALRVERQKTRSPG